MPFRAYLASKQAESGFWPYGYLERMTDISTLIGRLLPFAVIASLALIFYLLDVYSVGSGLDAEPAKVAARQATAVEPRATAAAPPAQRSEPVPLPPPSVASDVTAPPSQGQAPAESVSNFQTESEFPAQGEAPEPLPPPTASMEQDELNSTAPSYVPPAGSPGQPLASDMDTTEPIQLPNDEITQEESERIENESLQALEEAEQAASQPGAVEQEQ